MRDSLDLRTGSVVAGAALLVLSLFLDWYDPGISAWTAFELVDVLLLAGAALAVAAVLPGAAPQLRPALPWIGAAVLLLVLVNVLDPPPAAEDADREAGAGLGLLGAALLAAGALLSVFGISLRLDLEGRPAGAGHETPAPAPRPAPPAAGRPAAGSLFAREREREEAAEADAVRVAPAAAPSTPAVEPPMPAPPPPLPPTAAPTPPTGVAEHDADPDRTTEMPRGRGD